MFNLPKFFYDAARYNLGDAVGEQLEAVGNGEPKSDQNFAALRLCVEWMEANAYAFETSLDEDTFASFDSLLAHLHNTEED